MTDELEYLEDQIRRSASAHRLLILPILYCLADMGRPAPPREIKDIFSKRFGDRLSEGQMAYLVNKRLAWAGHRMRMIGLLRSDDGVWSLTALAEAYLARHADTVPEIPTDVPELSDKENPARVNVETVMASDFAGYGLPILEVLARGINTRREILDRLEDDLKPQLLPGDFRNLPNGHKVWENRAGWALSALKKAGEVKNPGVAIWEITDSGRRRLEQERDQWRLEPFQGSRARVIAVSGPGPDPIGPWTNESWVSFGRTISGHLFEILETRLRPDLGPTRSDDAIARNLILYGPPGTGKTFLAKAAARALTGEDEIGSDSRVRLVQFHPSYAYEDFVQGLRPDLEHTELRYELKSGPFLDMCAAATQDPDHYHVLVVDEINRGDPARIFGELLYALEYRDQPVELALGGTLTIPSNLVVLGTMNSVDRSVALVDYALRRRFGFVRVEPDPEVIVNLRSNSRLATAAAGLLGSFNEWLETKLDADHTLGHSFFLNPAIALESQADVRKVWDLDVRPLLEEYFFGDRESLIEAGKQWTSIFHQVLADLGDDET